MARGQRVALERRLRVAQTSPHDVELGLHLVDADASAPRGLASPRRSRNTASFSGYDAVSAKEKPQPLRRGAWGLVARSMLLCHQDPADNPENRSAREDQLHDEHAPDTMSIGVKDPSEIGQQKANPTVS